MKIAGIIPGNGPVEFELSDEAIKVIGEGYRDLVAPSAKEIGRLARILPASIKLKYEAKQKKSCRVNMN